MSEKPKRKKISWRQYISMVFLMLIGGVCGFLMVAYIEGAATKETALWIEILSLFGLLISMYIAFFVQVVIHEAGHLVFGKLSGYTFSSFRVFSFMWIKEKNKIRFRRLSLAGTGGQCLMVPPDMNDGKIPVVLYNMGGSIMNILVSLLFLVLFALTAEEPYLSLVMLISAVVGFAFAIMNGVPMRLGTMDNDGYNAFALRKNSDAMRGFWVQLRANEQIASGVRLKDMPEAWFVVPSDAEMKNSMVAVIGVFACNRLIDEHRFEDADQLMAHLLDIDSGIVGLHRNLLICDRLFCELIGENKSDTVEALRSEEQQKFMKSMKNFPSVLRSQYTYALLAKKDFKQANEVETQLEKCAKSYPYPSEIQAERELIEIAKIAADREQR